MQGKENLKTKACKACFSLTILIIAAVGLFMAGTIIYGIIRFLEFMAELRGMAI